MYQTVQIYCKKCKKTREENGENIASYNSLGGGWTDIQTKEEHKYFDETASIYLQAFREARAEMKAAQPAPSVETSVNIQA